jgi:hypothetical protein
MAEVPFYKKWLLKKEDGANVDASEDKAWYDGIDWGGMAQRIGFESVPAAAAFTGAQKYARSLPQVGGLPGLSTAANVAKLAIPPVAGMIGGLVGKRGDQALGNELPGDDSIMSDILAAGGGAMPIGIDVAGGALRRTAMGWKEGTRAATDKALRESEQFGIQPTAGQITDKSLVQTFERLLRQMPVSGPGVERAHRKAYDEFQNAIRHLTDDGTLDLSTDAFAAGQKIQESAGRRVDAFNNRANALFRMVDKVIPNRTQIPLTKTQEFVQDHAGKFLEPTQELRDALGDTFIEKIRLALMKDTGEIVDGVAVRSPLESWNWHDLNVLRRQVGRRTTKPPSDTFDPKFARQLYKAILDDMEVVVRQIDAGALRGPVVPGSKDVALRAWRNAARYYRQGLKSMEETYDKVEAADPIRLFKSIENGSATDIGMARKASDPNTWRFVQAAVAERMGLAKAGLQDAEGQVFSPRAFLTNYNKFKRGTSGSKRGYDLMFGEAGKYRGISNELDVLARVADRMSQVSKPLQPSGNVHTGALVALGYGALTEPLTTAGAVAGLKGSSMLWTSPRFLSWLAKGENVRPRTRAFGNWVAAMPGYYVINQLSPSDETVLDDMRERLEQVATNDLPETPQGFNPTHERLREGLAPGSLMGQVLPQV